MTKLTNATQLKEVTIAEWLEHLEFSIKAEKVPFLWGPPGVGKTVSTETFCKEKGWGFIDFMLPMMDNIDVSGTPEQVLAKVFDENGCLIPDASQTRTDFAPPKVIPLEGDLVEEEYVIIFLDEMPNASPMTINACFKLIDEGKLGTRKLHPKVRFVGAGNPVTTSRASNELAEPLKNRVQHYVVRSSAEVWIEHATKSGYHPAIISYIDMDGSALNYNNQEPEAIRKSLAEGAFNTERSWTRLSKSLALMEEMGKSPKFITTECAATVGEGQALAFTEFYRNNKDMPTPKEICSGKAKECDFDIGQRYFLINCMVAHMVNLKTTMDRNIADGKATGVYFKQTEFCDAVNSIYEYFDKVLSSEECAVFIWRLVSTSKIILDFQDKNKALNGWISESNGKLQEYFAVLN